VTSVTRREGRYGPRVPNSSQARPASDPTECAALFDFGGVFTESPFHAFASFAQEIEAPPDEVVEIVFGPYHEDTDHPWHRLERGELSLADARDSIMALARSRGLEIDPLRVLAGMSMGGVTRERLVEQVRALRQGGIKTALVTNNAHEFREHWRPVLPLVELFDEVVDSSEVGMRKPDPAIFRYTLERLGRPEAAACVFLDDAESNVEAARALGIHGILVGPDPAAAIAELLAWSKARLG